MTPDANEPDDPVGRPVKAVASLVSSNHDLWERTKANGLPHWALWALGVTIAIGVAGAAGVYLATRSLLAAAAIPALCWLVALAVLSMADLDRRAQG